MSAAPVTTSAERLIRADEAAAMARRAWTLQYREHVRKLLDTGALADGLVGVGTFLDATAEDLHHDLVVLEDYRGALKRANRFDADKHAADSAEVEAELRAVGQQLAAIQARIAELEVRRHQLHGAKREHDESSNPRLWDSSEPVAEAAPSRPEPAAPQDGRTLSMVDDLLPERVSREHGGDEPADEQRAPDAPDAGVTMIGDLVEISDDDRAA